MGFHICEYCQAAGNLGKEMRFSPLSSADVTLRFPSGRNWSFPHTGLLHYVTIHNFLPPKEFIDDVMSGSVLSGGFGQTKSSPTPIGYLDGPGFPTGPVPQGFVEKLEQLIEKAKGDNDFRLTRGRH